MSDQLSREENHLLTKKILAIHEQGWGIGIGSVLGLGLFIATNILVVKGGEDMGSHLGLLRLYFPGYSVSFVGSLIGFVWAFVAGYAIGRVIATIYNRLTANMR